MTKTEKILFSFLLFMIIGCATMSYIAHENLQEIERLEHDKTELQSKLNIKNAEIEVAKRDLEEAHEMAGLLFLESMAVTDSYNELKKQCKKVKR